jgi:hypothetical protein
MNKNMLNKKYKDIISYDKEQFVRDVNKAKAGLNLNDLGEAPLLVYTDNKRQAIFYTLCMYHALRTQRILDYSIQSGRFIVDQAFKTVENRDMKMYDEAYYNDILFITLTQYDLTNDYINSILLDLVEFRTNQHKVTVVLYDIMDMQAAPYRKATAPFLAYFNSREYNIRDLRNPNALADAFSKPEGKAKPRIAKNVVDAGEF